MKRILIFFYFKFLVLLKKKVIIVFKHVHYQNRNICSETTLKNRFLLNLDTVQVDVLTISIYQCVVNLIKQTSISTIRFGLFVICYLNNYYG